MGGIWDENFCGDWVCGEQFICFVIIFGCDCGKGKNFDLIIGCFDDMICFNLNEKLCTDFGGIWDPNFCGDWKCGQFLACVVIVFGCNCGVGKSFDGAQGGCYDDSNCGLVFLVKLMFSEFDYDQLGMDTMEFIELYNLIIVDFDVMNAYVVLINGFNGVVYDNVFLVKFGMVGLGEYIVVKGKGWSVGGLVLVFGTYVQASKAI